MRPIALSASGGQYVEYLELEAAERAYWEGLAARILDIEREYVTQDQVEALSQGIDPKTGDTLRHRIQKTTMYDLTIQAPKAASVAGLLDDRIPEAHRECVRQTRQEMEKLAAAHTHFDGEDQHYDTHNLLQARFDHRCSRPVEKNEIPDPHLHTHILTMNVTFVPELGEWRALNAERLYRSGFSVSEAYRERLAGMLESWGYKLEARLVNAERYPRPCERYPEQVGFRIQGIPLALEQKFSQRSQARETYISQFKQTHGQEPIQELIDYQIASKRETKGEQIKLAPDELRQLQLSRLTPSERDTLIRVRDEALERVEKHRHSLREDERYEKPLQKQDWDYGETFRPRMRV